MGIGTGVALIVIGAILAFAINVPPNSFINISVVGEILMVGGAFAFVAGLIVALRPRTSRTTVSNVEDRHGRVVSQKRVSSAPEDF